MSALPAISGRVLYVGDDVSTDLIYPARFMPLRTSAEQALHVFSGLGQHVTEQANASAVVVAGWNMGCGSSREQAVTALRAAGIRVVIARSFSRLFFRNCINTGMPIVESEALVDALTAMADLSDLSDPSGAGRQVGIDLNEGRAMLGNATIGFDPLPEALKQIVAEGGLLAQLKLRGKRSADAGSSPPSGPSRNPS